MWQLPAIFFLSHTDWRLIVVEKKSSNFWRRWHSDAVDCLVFLMGTKLVLIPVYLSLYYFLVDSTHVVVCICSHTISPPQDCIYIYIYIYWGAMIYSFRKNYFIKCSIFYCCGLLTRYCYKWSTTVLFWNFVSVRGDLADGISSKNIIPCLLQAAFWL